MGKIILILWGFLFFDYIIENQKKENQKRNKKKVARKQQLFLLTFFDNMVDIEKNNKSKKVNL